MNNEPVAWTDGNGHYFDKNSFFPVDDLIPLYTHPADLNVEALKTFYEDRLEAGRKREETLLKTIETLLRKTQEK